MSSSDAPDTADAIVVGSGPNGLAAAVTLGRAGLSVHVIEGAATPGGGCRTEELTLSGFRHDVCSAVHPLAGASPFFTGTDLSAHGVRLLTPKVAFAQPLDGGRAAAAHGSVDETAGGLGPDGRACRQLLGPLVHDVPLILPAILAPLRTVPGHPAAMARFGLEGLLPAGRSPGRLRPAGRRARFTWAARSPKSRGANQTWPQAGTPSTRSAWWHSRAWSIQAGRQTGSRRCGVTATCRPAPPFT